MKEALRSGRRPGNGYGGRDSPALSVQVRRGVRFPSGASSNGAFPGADTPRLSRTPQLLARHPPAEAASFRAGSSPLKKTPPAARPASTLRAGSQPRRPPQPGRRPRGPGTAPCRAPGPGLASRRGPRPRRQTHAGTASRHGDIAATQQTRQRTTGRTVPAEQPTGGGTNGHHQLPQQARNVTAGQTGGPPPADDLRKQPSVSIRPSTGSRPSPQTQGTDPRHRGRSSRPRQTFRRPAHCWPRHVGCRHE